MSTYSFLLTYSVSPTSDGNPQHCEKADKLRHTLNRVKLDDWTKLTAVETTFIGSIEVNAATSEQKRQQAQTSVWQRFKGVMDSLDAYSDTTINVALMVQGSGDVIEFVV